MEPTPAEQAEQLAEQVVHGLIIGRLKELGIKEFACLLCKKTDWKAGLPITLPGNIKVLLMACRTCGRIEFFWADQVATKAAADIQKILSGGKPQ